MIWSTTASTVGKQSENESQMEKSMDITVVGAGYVGLVSGVCLASVGHHVICVDAIHDRVASINQAKAPFYEPGLEGLLSSALNSGHFIASVDLSEAVSESQITIITVDSSQGGLRGITRARRISLLQVR